MINAESVGLDNMKIDLNDQKKLTAKCNDIMVEVWTLVGKRMEEDQSLSGGLKIAAAHMIYKTLYEESQRTLEIMNDVIERNKH